MKAYLFPGQGSQQVGMGAALFDQFPDRVAEADEILGYSLKQLCLEDPNEELGQTQFTQPALFAVGALAYDACEDPHADFMAGHSLGEYAALYAAGMVDFGTGLRLSRDRGALMAKVSGGGMAAVIGLSAEAISEALQGAGMASIDIANYNSLGQIVVSGPAGDMAAAGEACKGAGAKMFVPLKVSGAFHSRYMREPAEQFRAALDAVTFSAPKTTVLANVSAQPYTVNEAAENLIAQIYSPVRWTETIQYFLDTGVEEFVELGSGNVLSKLVKQIQRGR